MRYFRISIIILSFLLLQSCFQSRSKRALAPAPTKNATPGAADPHIQTTYTDDVTPAVVNGQNAKGDVIEGLERQEGNPDSTGNAGDSKINNRNGGNANDDKNEFMIRLKDGRSVPIDWSGNADVSLDENFKIR